MKRRVLDTNVLIALWKGPVDGIARVTSSATAERGAREWLARSPGDGIVTPVRLEFLGGTRDRDELLQALRFLGGFEVFDEGHITAADWEEAERLVKRVPFSGRTRGALDCLIVAIAGRFHAVFYSHDTGAPKDRSPP